MELNGFDVFVVVFSGLVGEQREIWDFCLL